MIRSRILMHPAETSMTVSNYGLHEDHAEKALISFLMLENFETIATSLEKNLQKVINEHQFDKKVSQIYF